MKIQHKVKDKRRNIRVVDCLMGKVYLRQDARGVPRYYIRTSIGGENYMINLSTGLSSMYGEYRECPDAVMTPYPGLNPEDASNG